MIPEPTAADLARDPEADWYLLYVVHSSTALQPLLRAYICRAVAAEADAATLRQAVKDIATALQQAAAIRAAVEEFRERAALLIQSAKGAPSLSDLAAAIRNLEVK